MNKILIILCLVFLTSCGPSAEEKRQVEIEQQRIEKEASEKLAQEKAHRIAAVTCSIMGATRKMDAAVRVREMNEARDKIGEEPFLRGDYAIKEALEWGLCQKLVLNETYDEILQSLKDDKWERERIAAEKRAEENRIAAEKRAEKQRIADSKLTVKETFYSDGKLKSRTNYQSKIDGGKQDGLFESYHYNGQLKERTNYKDGKGDGLSENYYSDGQLWIRSNYKGGKRDGLKEMYSWDGKLSSTSCWDNGEAVDMSYCEK